MLYKTLRGELMSLFGVKCSFVLLCVLPVLGFASGTSSAATSTQEQIQKAQEFMLERKRKEALELLLFQIERTPERSKNYKELQSALQQLSQIFFTESAQKSYELAESLYYSRSKGADRQYLEALEEEPLNVLVLLGWTRWLLSKDKFSQAKKHLEVLHSLNPYLASLHRLKLYFLVFSGEWVPHLEVPATLKKKAFLKILQLKLALEQKKLKTAEQLIQELGPWKDLMPEAYYYRFLFSEQIGMLEAQWGNEYLSRCAKMDSALMRRFQDFPTLCTGVEDVQNKLSFQEDPGAH
jgi:hypothetical protein